ncbi:MAG: hypothetical protein Q9212_003566 [Teloschistes hypoglaucus]
MQLSILLIGALATAAYWLLCRYLAVEQDPREPPLVSSRIPLVGHLIGLIWHKNNYYVTLRQRYSHPIYTLNLPTSKLYVVNSVEIISAVQRYPKALAFPPFEAKFATTVCASSKESNDIIALNLNGEDGDWGYSHDFHQSMRSALAPGAGIDGMNRVMIQNLAGALERLRPTDGQPTKIGLADWTRHEITLATTNSVYGVHNPFKHPRIERAFWEFENGLVMILIDVLPSLTARSSCRAREVVGEAFREYFEAKHHKTGSILVQNRYNTSVENKMPVADIARHELVGSFAILVNTAPATFWLLFFIFSHPEVLEECREEVGKMIRISSEEGQAKTTLDITGIKQNCPTLTSTYQEVLRQRTLGVQARQVMKDITLDNTYLLKKGATVMMPSLVVHTDPAVWGSDVSDFNHKRFTNKGSSRNKEVHRPSPKAFRVFGGGSTLCPGRHFATTAILSAVVMFIMRYDIVPVGGQWISPKTDKTNIASVVMEPDTDIQVEVTPRKGFADGKWEFGLADSKMVFGIVAEDQ